MYNSIKYKPMLPVERYDLADDDAEGKVDS